MFAGPRKSITALFMGDTEEPIIGRQISMPTKSFSTPSWAEDQKTSTNNKADSKSTDSEQQLRAELKHEHMSLLAERARVQELEKQMKSLMEKKYSNQSNIIDQLRSSQDRLREQLHLVIQSKMDLCESTSSEIERLRIIIAELASNLMKLNGAESSINIEAILSKYKINSSAPLLGVKATAVAAGGGGRAGAQKGAASPSEAKESDEKGNELFIQRYQSLKVVDKRPLEEQLNNPRKFDENMPPHLRPFPHRDIARIDIRTVSNGDLVTYPDPFAAVDLKYTGYKHLREENQWTKFTSTNISSTVFETRLGNHENIIGLEQAVLSMTKGEVARVWVPSRLGYGVHGAEPLIPPNTDLVFELTLVEIRNDFAISNHDQDDDPLDPHQLAHIRQGDELSSPNENQYANTHSQLTTNNLNTLNSINSMNQTEDTMQFAADNGTYNEQENELLGYDDADEYASNQQNSFQVL